MPSQSPRNEVSSTNAADLAREAIMTSHTESTTAAPIDTSSQPSTTGVERSGTDVDRHFEILRHIRESLARHSPNDESAQDHSATDQASHIDPSNLAPPISTDSAPRQGADTEAPMANPMQMMLAGMMSALTASQFQPPGQDGGASNSTLNQNAHETRDGRTNENNDSASSNAQIPDRPNQQDNAARPHESSPRSMFLQQQFMNFVNEIRSGSRSSAGRADPDRAKELLKALQDPGKYACRRLVRLSDVEDARGEEAHNGMQCGICLDQIEEIILGNAEQNRADAKDGSANPPEPTVDKSITSTTISVEPSSLEQVIPTVEPTIEDFDMTDVELIIDAEKRKCKEEDTCLKIFPCNHVFCNDCLVPWLSTHTTW